MDKQNNQLPTMDQKTAFKIAKSYIDFLRENNYNIQRAYIFGSYARGNFHEDSDIDLALVLKNLSNGVMVQIDLMRLRRQFDIRLEPHPLDEKDFEQSTPFVNEVIRTGVQIV